MMGVGNRLLRAGGAGMHRLRGPSVISTSASKLPDIEERGLVARFEDIAAAHGSRLAIASAEGEISYEALNGAANQLAHGLISANLPMDRPVALLLEKGTPHIRAMLAVMKTGGFVVPLDPANPPARNAQILEDSGASVILRRADDAALAAQIGAHLDCTQMDVDELSAGRPTTNPGIHVPLETLAYVLYTSGSTGRPKGVVHDQRGVLHNMQQHLDVFDLSAHDRQTLLETCSVYGGNRDIFNALLNGASLHPYNVKQLGIAGLPQWLRDSRITIYCSVVTVFRQLVAALGPQDQFPDLRFIKLGGEASNRRDIELFRERFPRSCRVHCGLGSTETGMSRNFVIDHDTPLDSPLVPLGYAIDGVDVQLLDEQGRPVARNETGEIVVRSRYIFREYWRRPDLNTTVVTRDPADPDVRIYRTGDLGQLAADGCLVHRGRKDHLVKLRGNRIELPEIEVALRDHGVEHAAVLVRLDGRREEYLAAYVVPRGGTLNSSELRAALIERLPDFMVPAVFVFLPALPQTPNGKIDRLALPEPGSGRPRLSSVYQAPTGALEAELTALWSDLLTVDLVGVDDSFFDLGGNSLIAVRLMAQIRVRHQIDLPLATLLQADTVRKLAVQLETVITPEWLPLVAIKPGGNRRPLFCVHPLGGNVLGYKEFVDLLDPDQPVYGLQAHGVIDGQRPLDDIPQMASIYVEEMRRVQPEGPYSLGGESFGGLVAWEMASQLQAAGCVVEFLFIGDVWPRNLPSLPARSRLLSDLGHSLTLRPGQWLELLKRRLFGTGPAKQYVRRYTFATELHRANSLAHLRAIEAFQPRPFAGDVTLFRATEHPHGVARLQHFLRDETMGWSQLARRVNVQWMPDEHYEMMHGKNAAGFAHALQAALDRARAGVLAHKGPPAALRESVSATA